MDFQWEFANDSSLIETQNINSLLHNNKNQFMFFFFFF